MNYRLMEYPNFFCYAPVVQQMKHCLKVRNGENKGVKNARKWCSKVAA